MEKIKKVPWNEVGTAQFTYSIAGPIATHNYLCSVCREYKGVLDLRTGILQPCWKCQKQYKTVRLNWFYKIFEKFGKEEGEK